MQYAELLHAIAWLTERMPKGPLQMYGPWWAYLLSDLAQPNHTDRCNPSGLNHTCDQSDGLVANTSGRREQHGINLLLA